MASRNDAGFAESATIFERGEVREVQASVAKSHFSQLLDEVEGGTTIVILRHGRPVARLIPDAQQRQREKIEALEDLRRLGKESRAKHGPMTTEEILSLRHEGHKY